MILREEVGGGRDGEQLQRRVWALRHVRAGLVQVIKQVAQVAQLLLLRMHTSCVSTCPLRRVMLTVKRIRKQSCTGIEASNGMPTSLGM